MPIIDGSVHQHLLNEVPKRERNDRPDILHFGLLTALGYRGLLQDMEVYFSCKYGLFHVNRSTKLPRSQTRFYGILETIFNETYSGNLIEREGKNVQQLNGTKVFLSSCGEPLSSDHLTFENFIFGGFSTGFFKTRIAERNKVVSISESNLDLWTAISLFLNYFIKS